MLFRMEYRKSIFGITSLLIGVLCLSLVFVVPVKAQEIQFMGEYEVRVQLVGIQLEGSYEIYLSVSNESLDTYFGDFSPYMIAYLPDYRLESSSDGYIDFLDQNSYSDEDGHLIKSETTYDLHLDGYQQVTFTSTYEYGNYTTITDNSTLFEETYNERYYEDGIFQESNYYHEYTYVWLDEDDSVFLENVTVPAGEYECFVLDNYVFEGLESSIDDWEPHGESASSYQGGTVVWLDAIRGFPVQQIQYDESDEIIGEFYLMVEPDIHVTIDNSTTNTSTPESNSSLLLLGGGGAAAVGIVAVVALLVRRRGGSSYEPYPYGEIPIPE